MNDCSIGGEIQKSTREQQKDQRSRQILETALDLFIRKGYAGTRIQDIAAAAGMSTGLLFHYYPSKEKLYEELVRIGLSGTQKISTSDIHDVIEFFRQSATMIFDVVKKSPFFAKIFVLMGQAGHNEAAPESARKLALEVRVATDCVPLIEKGQRDGTIREGNPVSLSVAFWSSIQGIAESIALSPELECPDPDWVVDILRKR
jgi:AcrR family transcriptional regulator